MNLVAQNLLQETAAQALRHLAVAVQEEAAGSRRWNRLVKIIEAVEAIESLADATRDTASELALLNLPAPTMRPERLSLANLLSGSTTDLKAAA